MSYRGLGEVDVGITHSFGVILCGYAFQGGNLGDSFPWLLGVPLFLAILPSITLSGVPDYEADKAVRKRTIAVRSGRMGAAVVAICFTVLATAAGIGWNVFVLPEAFGNAIYGTVPHAALLVWLPYRYMRSPAPPSRIDTLMVVSLTYLLWFGIIPLVKLM